MDYIKLDWDSKFLGFKVCKIMNTNISCEDELREILLKAKKEYYRLCYFIFPEEKKLLDEIAKINCGLLVDVKITYTIYEINTIELILTDEVIEYNNYIDINKLYNLAIQSSYKSRFRFDKNFNKNVCDDLYRIWVDRSISGELAKKVYIYYENSNVKGMITIDINDNIGVIGLLGVDINDRGKKIGKKLVHKTFDYLIKKGIYKVRVDTQKRNIVACRFYEKCGFNISKILMVYHFWL